LRFVRRATIALFVLIAAAVAGAAVLYVAKDWLVAIGVRVGLEAYNARLNSTLHIQDVSLDVFRLTATIRGITIAERGQRTLGAPIYVRQAQAKLRLWPLIQRRLVIEEVSASEASVRLDIDGRNRVNLETLFQLLVDDTPGTPSPWNIVVRRFVVDRVGLDLSMQGQPLRATLYNLAFQGAMTLDPLHIRTEMLEGQGEIAYRLGPRPLYYRLRQHTAAVDLVRDRLTVEHLRVEAPEFIISGQGSLERGQVAAQFTADLGLAALAALMPGVPTPTGKLTARGSLAGHLDAPLLTVTAEGPGLTVGPYTASDLGVKAQLAGRRVHIEGFGLGVAMGTVRGSGTLDLAPQRVDLHVELADLSLAALSSLIGHPFATLGGQLGGQVHIASPAFDVEHVQVEGRLRLEPPAVSQEPTPAAAPVPWPLRLTADFRFAEGTLMLGQVTWGMDGLRGEVSGTQRLDGTAQLVGAVVADLTAPIFRQLGLPDAQGSMQATFSVQGRLPDPRVNAEMRLHQASYRGVPIGHLRLAVEAEGAEVRIRSLTGTQGQARYHLHGAFTLAAPFSRLHQARASFPVHAIPELQLQIEQADLAALASLLPTPMPFAGALTLRATAAGTWPDVRGESQIAVRGLAVRGEVLGDISLVVAGSTREIGLKRLVAHLGGGEVHANGTVSLPRRLIDLAMTWQGVPVERLASLHDLALPVSGALNGSMRARGTWPDLSAEVSVQGRRLSAHGLEVADLQLQARASPRALQLERLAARVAGARLTVTGRAAVGGPIDFQLASESIPLRGLAFAPHKAALNGRAKLDLAGSGSFTNPQLRGRMRLSDVQVGGLTVGTGTLALTLSDRRITFSSAGLQGVTLNGSVALTEALPAQVHVGMRALNLGPIVAQLAGDDHGTLVGDVSGTVAVSGPLRSLPQLTGLITLDHLRLRSNGIEVANPAPLRWRLAQGVLRFEAVALQVQGAHLEVRGTADLWQERLDLAILGRSPLAIVGTRVPGLRFQQGTLDTQLTIRGRPSAPVFDGQVLLKEGAVYIAAINDNLSQLSGEIRFTDQTIAIQSVQGQLAGGSLGVAGEVRLRGFHLHEVSLTTQVHQVRLRYPAGFFALLDAELVISGNAAQQLIAGEVNLSRARYRQEVDLPTLLRQFRQRALEPPAMAQDKLQLDLRLASRDPLRVENRLVKLQLLPDLHVRGSVSRPVVLGRVEIDRGTADVAGTRLSPISGSVDFLNPARTEPFFDLAADTQKSGYQIHVVATGTPQRIDLQLTSEPPLAEPDILALLTVGATGQALTTGLTTVLPDRVSAFLTGRIAEEIGRGAGGLVGVDRLDIEPLVGGAQRVGGPKVTVGKDVSRDLSVTYSTIVGSTQEDTVTVEYRLTDQISILGVRDERGDIGVDVKYSIRFE
jgi:autotransporter translocation and assembly factor TamB